MPFLLRIVARQPLLRSFPISFVSCTGCSSQRGQKARQKSRKAMSGMRRFGAMSQMSQMSECVAMPPCTWPFIFYQTVITTTPYHRTMLSFTDLYHTHMPPIIKPCPLGAQTSCTFSPASFSSVVGAGTCRVAAVRKDWRPIPSHNERCDADHPVAPLDFWGGHCWREAAAACDRTTRLDAASALLMAAALVGVPHCAQVARATSARTAGRRVQRCMVVWWCGGYRMRT